MATATLPTRTRIGKPVRIGNTARVTFSTKTRTAAPGLIRARIALFGEFDCTGKDATEPRIVAQGNGWMTWESTYTPTA
jgi:hypothetical protein